MKRKHGAEPATTSTTTATVRSLERLCLDALVRVLHDSEGSSNLKGEGEKAQLLILQVPGPLVGELLALYTAADRLRQRQMYHRSLERVLDSEDVHEMNTCPACGNQDAIDISALGERFKIP